MSHRDLAAGTKRPAPRGHRPGATDHQLVDRIVGLFRVGDRSALTPRRPLRRHSWRPDAGQAIGASLELARRATEMDVALLGEIRDGREVVRALAGDGQSFGITLGASAAIEETYCHHLLEGRLHNIVSDARSDGLVRDLELTKIATIGAYIGVPVTTLQARLYILCCLAHERRPLLTQRHVLLLRQLAEKIATELDATPV